MLSNAIVFAGLGLTVLVVTGIVWFRLAMQVAIPDRRLGFLALWGLAALLGLSSFFSAGATWFSGIVGGLAAIGGLMLLGLHLLRKQGVGQTISVGDKLPVFSAADETGVTFDSATAMGSPLLVKFFRGHW